MSNVQKLYAAFKAGYLGDNILNTYFSLVANMVLEERIRVIEGAEIRAMLKKRYGLQFPLPFIHQVLGEGVRNHCFIEDHGKYSVVVEELTKYSFNPSDFDASWKMLLTKFQQFCQKLEVTIADSEIEAFLLTILDISDNIILSGEKPNEDGMKPEEYAWYSFVKETADSNSDLYRFITAISASNITKQALFYMSEGRADFSDLHIYLDSPIIFALLGMDDPARTEAYRTLVTDMQQAGCQVHVLDHNFQEVDGIIARAAEWANSTQYDIRKANNAARFFHDSRMTDDQISEFCASIETQLNQLNITQIETHYDIYEHQFHEDEIKLFDMVKEKYDEHDYELTPEKEKSIHVDVCSIVMIYRERQGQTATRIQNAKHLMLTSNNAIANVSRNYESNRSINSGHIPACVSADLFGAILWLNQPMRMMQYQKSKLLADCYSYLQPDKKMLEKYIQSLDEARDADQIDEKTFLFLRTHKVVRESLMNVTRGDYARFNSHTYLEVYNDIQARAEKHYEDEAASHEQTRKVLERTLEQASNDKEEYETKIGKLSERVEQLEAQEQQRKQSEFEKKVAKWGRIITYALIGTPYVLLFSFFEISKAHFSQFTGYSIVCVSVFVVLSILALALYNKGKGWCFKRVRAHFLHKEERENSVRQEIDS